jgi:hypothetical protein
VKHSSEQKVMATVKANHGLREMSVAIAVLRAIPSSRLYDSLAGTTISLHSSRDI